MNKVGSIKCALNQRSTVPLNDTLQSTVSKVVTRNFNIVRQR